MKTHTKIEHEISDANLVTILLPIYNGARFLAPQLDSLLSQTYSNWICIARDDGSNDGSLEIFKQYIRNFPDNFFLIIDNLGNLGTVACLNQIALNVRSPYFALCDQDDVWQLEKLETCVNSLLKLSSVCTTPLLSYSDLKVTDEFLGVIAPSFWDMIQYRRYAIGLSGLPVLNVVAGCSMVGNMALLKAAFPIPEFAPMHDYWLGMVAKFSGQVIAIERPLLLYRQHGKNQLGAGKVEKKSIFKRIVSRILTSKEYLFQSKIARQKRIKMLNELIERRIPSLDYSLCERSIRADEGNVLLRLLYLYRMNIRPDHAFSYWLTW